MKKIFIVLSILFIVSNIYAQNNVAHTRISILTCGPGDELYSLFGHTAIRIIDSNYHSDVVYNWGGFTFDQPNFYLKFARGKLMYFSSADYFSDFMYEYITDKRNVYEQVLNVDSVTKKKILDAVYFNSTGDNRFYKYDFLLDNCTTRVKNIVFNSDKSAVINTRLVPDGTTARDMIHYYLERGNQLWTELGLDILLGSRMDKTVSNDEAMFLPEFFMKGLSDTQDSSYRLVTETKTIFKGNDPPTATWKFFPLTIVAIVCALLFFISSLNSAWAKSVMRFFDMVLLYVTGLIGLLLLFMWFGTDHTVCKNNLNLFWALPTNFIAAFLMIKKPMWLSTYFLITTIITALFLAAWFWLPQQLNIALLPVILLLLNRYVHFTIQLRNKFSRA